MAGAAVAGGLLPLLGAPRRAVAAAASPSPPAPPRPPSSGSTTSLTDEQRKAICFPFDHPLRTKINANWAITKPTIEDDFTKEQQAILDEIFRGVISPDGYERFQKQMDDDAGGFGQYHVAVFGTPGSGQFEWEMTGRHLTIRADGDSVAERRLRRPDRLRPRRRRLEEGPARQRLLLPDPEGQRGLQGPRRQAAREGPACPRPRRRPPSPSRASSGKFPGIAVGELSADQKELVESVMKVILAPYREEDVDEAIAILKAGGGLDALHMAFYEADDIGKRPGVGHLAARRPDLRLALPRRPARPRLRQHRQEGLRSIGFGSRRLS